MADTVLLAAVLAAIAALALFLRTPKRSHPLPPGPPRKPILGNATDVPKAHKELAFAKWAKQYGPVTYLSAFGKPIVILNTAKVAMDLLHERSAIYSSRPKSHMADVMGYSSSTLLAPYGEVFRASRKLMNTALNSRTARTYWPIQEQAVHSLLGRFLKSPAQFREHIKRVSSAVILKVAYGYTLEEDDPVLPLVEETTFSFGQAVGGGYWVDYLPFLKKVPIQFWIKSTREFVIRGRQLSGLIRQKLYDHVVESMAKGDFVPSFTSTLIEAKGKVTGSANETELIKSAAAILFGAGSDTSTASIASFVLAMALYPEIQEKAQAELAKVVGPDRLPNWDDRENLPYVDAILKETLRWNVAVPLGVPHAVIQDDVYEGMFIPGGATVISNIWAILRDESEYPDPFAFKPERFLVENPPTDPHQYAFGFGRRVCPGRDVASATVYMAIASTLHTFNISKAKDASGKPVVPSIDPATGWTTGLVMHPTEFPAEIVPRSEKAVSLINAAVDQIQNI